MVPRTVSIFLIFGATGATLTAQPIAAAEALGPVEAGQRALEECSPLPWYDASHDGVQRVDVLPRGDDRGRHSNWRASEELPAGRAKPSAAADWFWSGMQVLAWGALAALIAAVMWAVVWAAARVSGKRLPKEKPSRLGNLSSRIEQLPLPVATGNRDLWSMAREYLQAGDLSNAIIHAFAHQLVQLDKSHLIQLAKGKTNRQYMYELRAHPQLVKLLGPAMHACEEVFFGRHKLSRQRFDICWEELQRLDQQLEGYAK